MFPTFAASDSDIVSAYTKDRAGVVNDEPRLFICWRPGRLLFIFTSAKVVNPFILRPGRNVHAFKGWQLL